MQQGTYYVIAALLLFHTVQAHGDLRVHSVSDYSLGRNDWQLLDTRFLKSDEHLVYVDREQYGSVCPLGLVGLDVDLLVVNNPYVRAEVVLDKDLVKATVKRYLKVNDDESYGLGEALLVAKVLCATRP